MRTLWGQSRRALHEKDFTHVATGTIKKLVGDRGFGFIAMEDGAELFFHRSAVEGDAFDSLREGQAVRFEKGTDPKRGKPQGEKVAPV